MLRLSIEHRPRQVVAVYVEQQRVEVLRAHRQWRSWQIDAVEQFDVPPREPIYDYLQRLNLRSRNPKATTLILFLPLTFYTFHREHYPSGLQDQLQEALNYDWQENIFLEHERTLHFPGPAIPLNHHLSVPIFTLQREIFDKFEQVLGAPSFQNFRVIPSALMYRAFLASQSWSKDKPALEVFARLVDASHLELHRLYKGQLLDSLLLAKNRDDLELILGHLRLADRTGNGEDAGEPATPIRLICADGEMGRTEAHESLCKHDLCFELERLDGSLVSSWLSYLFNQDQIQSFDAPLILKPWKIPRIVWPLLAVLGVYAVFAVLQLTTHRQLMENSRRLKKEIAQLETQWKPIEELQTRIAKFQEDQKTLSEFNREGYPLFEILTVLSQATPEDTWLNYFSIKKGQIVLRGDSKSAIKFLSELSKIDGFSDVRFASPVTRSPSSEDERFNVQYQLDSEKLKKTVDALGLDRQEETIDQDATDEEPGPGLSPGLAPVPPPGPAPGPGLAPVPPPGQALGPAPLGKGLKTGPPSQATEDDEEPDEGTDEEEVAE